MKVFQFSTSWNLHKNLIKTTFKPQLGRGSFINSLLLCCRWFQSLFAKTKSSRKHDRYSVQWIHTNSTYVSEATRRCFRFCASDRGVQSKNCLNSSISQWLLPTVMRAASQDLFSLHNNSVGNGWWSYLDLMTFEKLCYVGSPYLSFLLVMNEPTDTALHVSCCRAVSTGQPHKIE